MKRRGQEDAELQGEGKTVKDGLDSSNPATPRNPIESPRTPIGWQATDGKEATTGFNPPATPETPAGLQVTDGKKATTGANPKLRLVSIVDTASDHGGSDTAVRNSEVVLDGLEQLASPAQEYESSARSPRSFMERRSITSVTSSVAAQRGSLVPLPVSLDVLELEPADDIPQKNHALVHSWTHAFEQVGIESVAASRVPSHDAPVFLYPWEYDDQSLPTPLCDDDPPASISSLGESLDANLQRISIVIHGARKLTHEHLGWDSTDSFCVCQISSRQEVKFFTNVARQTCDPVWEHGAEMEWYSKDDIQFYLWDDDMMESEELGSTMLSSKDIESYLETGWSGELQLFKNGEPADGHLMISLASARKQTLVPRQHVTTKTQRPPKKTPQVKRLSFITPPKAIFDEQAFRELQSTAIKKAKTPAGSQFVDGKGIMVNIQNASGLPGKCLPFVVCESRWSRNVTEVHYDSVNPTWNHEVQIRDYIIGDVLSFSVWDSDIRVTRAAEATRDEIPRNDLLGRCELKFDEYFPHGCEKHLTMPGVRRPFPALLVKVDIIGQPDPPIVEGKGIIITIVSARGLQSAGGNGRIATCAIHGNDKSKFETFVAKNSHRPIWEHSRQLVDFVEGDKLEFEVWASDDSDASRKGECLGTCGLSYADYFPEGCEKHLTMAGIDKAPPELYVKVMVIGKPHPSAETKAKLRSQAAIKGVVDEIRDLKTKLKAQGISGKKLDEHPGVAELVRKMAKLRPTVLSGKDKAGTKTEADVKLDMPIVPGKGILVTVKEASGLPNSDARDKPDEGLGNQFAGGLSDPFCSFQIPRKKESYFESHVVFDTLNPEWNFSRQILEYDEGDSLKFAVWDKDPGLGKDLLGRTELKFDSYYPAGGDHLLEMPGIHKPYPTLSVHVEILGKPKPKAEVKAMQEQKFQKNLKWGRRVPKTEPELSPRAQARFDARRAVLNVKCWSDNLRGEDEFTTLIPSKEERSTLTLRFDRLTLEHKQAFEAFRRFLHRRGGNTARAWRCLIDIDWRGRLTKTDLGTRCRELGCQINLKALWEVLDRKKDGFITFGNADPHSAEILARFYCAIEARRRSESDETAEDPGMRHGTALMRVLDVDDSKKLQKGEFLCAVSVLHLATAEDAETLFDMLHHADPSIASAKKVANPYVTEAELQWLHCCCEPFNLFDRINKRGKEKELRVLSDTVRVQAQEVLPKHGRLRKVYRSGHGPAVFTRLREDAERREDDYAHRFDEELLGVPLMSEKQAQLVSDRLYLDAYLREAQQELTVEAAWHQAVLDASKPDGRDKYDPEYVEKLAKARERPAKVQEQPKPTRSHDMDHIEKLYNMHFDKYERLENARQQQEAKRIEEEEKELDRIAEMRKVQARLRLKHEKERIIQKIHDETQGPILVGGSKRAETEEERRVRDHRYVNELVDSMQPEDHLPLPSGEQRRTGSRSARGKQDKVATGAHLERTMVRALPGEAERKELAKQAERADQSGTKGVPWLARSSENKDVLDAYIVKKELGNRSRQSRHSMTEWEDSDEELPDFTPAQKPNVKSILGQRQRSQDSYPRLRRSSFTRSSSRPSSLPDAANFGDNGGNLTPRNQDGAFRQVNRVFDAPAKPIQIAAKYPRASSVRKSERASRSKTPPPPRGRTPPRSIVRSQGSHNSVY